MNKLLYFMAVCLLLVGCALAEDVRHRDTPISRMNDHINARRQPISVAAASDKPAPGEMTPAAALAELDRRLTWVHAFARNQGWGHSEHLDDRIRKQDTEAVAKESNMSREDGERWHRLDVQPGDREKMEKGAQLWNDMLKKRLGEDAEDSPLRAELLTAGSIRAGIDSERKALSERAKKMGEAAGLEDWQMEVLMKQAATGSAGPDIFVQLTEIVLRPAMTPEEAAKEKEKHRNPDEDKEDKEDNDDDMDIDDEDDDHDFPARN